ncbi:DUF1707 domain-containing protein [Aeromicrobium sp. Leaf291]|uniref:DUF1707 SHOCT-like domain-containing protein n=1 Tax=Aeromicrobium sp. Leaf291 TaxID=1736325 RepID=UPI0006FEB92C|nr:DUF1707 domain-containing protein [Aeromicrobium sp. Leaf291]KQP85022.1 hypothetical protein ASF35_09390 [Aeromicrobium sp. Leaf291]
MTGEWDRLSADPSTPAAATLRASDADRDVVLGVLRDAYAEGRLDRAEYERRVEGALGVLVVADVVPLLSDLVAERRPAGTARSARTEAEEKVRRESRDSRNGWIGVTALTTGIWAATSAGSGELLFFWPVFPSLGIGFGWFMHHLNREQRVEELEEKIARKRRGLER